MGTDHRKPPTELREYLALLRQRDGAGRSLLWASKDLDLIGTEAEVARVART